MNRFFDIELETYSNHISRLLTLTHQQTRLSLEALLERNSSKSRKVLQLEDEVDELEIEIDSEAMRFLNLRAPIASELRLIMAGSRMSHEFERIGDEAKKIANFATSTTFLFPDPFVTCITEMSDLVEKEFDGLHSMLSELSDKRAEHLMEIDEKIDDLHKVIQDKLLDLIESDEIRLRTGFDLISVSRALERIGDHLQNIVEITVFLITGEDIRK